MSGGLASGLLRLPGRLPAGPGDSLGQRVGALARRLGVRRRVVEDQIARAFPEMLEEQVRELAAAAYHHFGRELVSTVRLARGGLAAVREAIAGSEAFAESVRATGPAVVVTGHVGNWELSGSALPSQGVPLIAPATPQHGAFDRAIGHMRAELGIETVPDAGSARRFRRILEDGGVVGLVADQHAAKGGVSVDFLGRPAATALGPARLALACDVPLYFGATLRTADRYHVGFEVVPTPQPGPGAAAELTRRWLGCLERTVLECPEQYYWFHRRWKISEGSENGATSRRDEPGGETGNGRAAPVVGQADLRPGAGH